MKIISLTAERLREVLAYSKETGLFTWIKPPIQKGFLLGKTAGSRNNEGYIQVIIDGENLKAHRLAWLYVLGVWPQGRLDHHNRIKSDNHWTNLRLATHSQNIANSNLRADSTSGVKGVHFQKDVQKWVAYVSKNRKRFYLGVFASLADAVRARRVAAVHLHGEFAS